MTPTLTPFPLFTAYEPDGVALIARMFHWHGPKGSGPVDSDTLYSVAQPIASDACECVPGGALLALARSCAKAPSRAAPMMPGERSTADAKLALDDATVAIPSLFRLRTSPPAAWIAASAVADAFWSTRTMYCCTPEAARSEERRVGKECGDRRATA